MRKFPWKGVMEREKDHLGKWEVVVQAKDAGVGLGMRLVARRTEALLGK